MLPFVPIQAALNGLSGCVGAKEDQGSWKGNVGGKFGRDRMGGGFGWNTVYTLVKFSIKFI